MARLIDTVRILLILHGLKVWCNDFVVKINGKISDLRTDLDFEVEARKSQALLASLQVTQALSDEALARVAGDKAITDTLTIKNGDKILDNSNGWSATLDLKYENLHIKLLGKDNAEIADIDAADFIRDGMLESADLIDNPEGLEAGKYIKLVFNSDGSEDPIFINVTSLVDVYSGGNGIDISNKNVSLTLDPSTEAYLTVGTAGLKLSGIKDALDLKSDSATVTLKFTEMQATLDSHGSSIDGLSSKLDEHVANTNNPHSVTKGQVGLANVDNTSDADKPISNATQNALNGKVDKVDNKSLVSVTEITKLTGLPNKTDLDTSISDAKKAGTDAQSFIDEHKLDVSNPHKVTKSLVGLSNVDNTADKDKSVKYATSAGSAPASDVSSWAKAKNKPSYSWDEITSKPSFATVATTGKYSDLSEIPESITNKEIDDYFNK